jgi:hypothetical protein
MPTHLPVAVPLHHRHITLPHHTDAEASAFIAMQRHWYQVADTLKTQPPGTVAVTPVDQLLLAPLNGELVLLSTPGLTGSETEADLPWLFRVEDTDEAGVQEYEAISRTLADWLASPIYGEPVSPVHLSRMVALVFGGESVPSWVWSGNDPWQDALQQLMTAPRCQTEHQEASQ